jgi:crotonobetaine/carnitine-CoA ligase
MDAVEEWLRDGPWDIGSLVEQRAEQYGDKVLLRMPGVTLTYREFDRRTNQRARTLRQLGVGRGDVVAQMLGNEPDFLVTWIALAKLGAIHIGINTEFRDAGLARLLDRLQTRVVVTSGEYAGRILDVLDRVSALEVLVRTDPQNRGGARCGRVQELFFEDIESADDGPLGIVVDHRWPSMFKLTSGTTGPSKAVEVSHHFSIASGVEVAFHHGLDETDTTFSPYPLYHGEATVATFIPALFLGATCAILPRFSVSSFWDDVREYGATFTTMMGAVMSFLWQQPERESDADNPLRRIGSAPTPSFWRDFETRFGLSVGRVYGSSEGGQGVWGERGVEQREGTCGLACDHFEVRVVDDYDRFVPAGELGEIVTRPRYAYGMMTRYFEEPEATVEVLRNLWYHSGDLGSLDGDGYLTFSGRKRDAIRRRGKNISAFEVEEVLDGHPDILESAVIGVPSVHTEEEVKAVVVVNGDRDLDVAAFVDWTRNRLPKYAVPRYVEVMAELPKTQTGKVQKSALRDAWRSTGTYDADTGTVVEPAGRPPVGTSEGTGLSRGS